MLLQNKSFLACNGLRILSGASTSVIGVPSNFTGSVGLAARSLLGGTISSKLNRYMGEATLYKGDAIPSGYSPSFGAWYPNVKAGGMSSRYQVIGAGLISAATLAGGMNMSTGSNILGFGTINTIPFIHIADHFVVNQASLTSLGEISNSSSMKGVITYKISDHIVLTGAGTIPDLMLKILAWSKATLTGEGDLDGTLQAPIKLGATLTGDGDVTGALVGMVYLLGSLTGVGVLTPDLRFPANLGAELEGEGSIAEDILLKAIAWCISSLIGTGTASGSLRGDSYLSATITSAGDVVTAESCAIAVWEALAAAHNKPSTMGKAMNSASSAGDPWTSLLENYTDDATFGAFIKELLTRSQFLTLK